MTKMIKALKQCTMPSQYALQQRANTGNERQLGAKLSFHSRVICSQDNEAIYPELGFLISKTGITVDTK